MKYLNKIKREHYYIAGVLAIMTVLIFSNINNSLLWKDEAINANIGYNTLKYGYPTIWDGKNLVSSTDGNSFNQQLISSNYEWLPFYLVAGSFAIFGKTTFAARLPFAIFATLSVLFVWMIAKRIFKSLPKTVCCTLLYGLNVQFLLYSFHSRYYSLILFGTAWSILAFIKLMEKYEEGSVSLKHSCLFALSIAFIFHSNRIAGVTIAMSIVLFLIIKQKIKHWKIIIPLLIGASTWLVWYFINSIILNAPSFGTDSIETHMITKILMICWKLQVYFFPFLSLLILYLVFKFIFIRKTEKISVNEYTSLFVAVIISNIVVVAAPRWGIINHYLVPVLVVAPFLVTAFLIYFYSKSKHIAAIIFLLLILSNVLNIWPYYLISNKTFEESNEAANLLSPYYSLTTNYGLISSPATDVNFRTQSLKEYIEQLELSCYLYDYIRQASTGYQSYLDETIKFLNENISSDETVLVLGFEFEPIMFYTNLRVVNNMTTRLKPWPDYFTAYPNQAKYEYLTRISDDEIDWIIYKNDGSEAVMFDNPTYLQDNINKFQLFPLEAAANVGLSNTPDLDIHKFANVKSDDNVSIYKRIK